MNKALGYTLIELMVAVGLFALVMTLVTGSYLVMIGINRNVQSVSTGINNLSFALEDMTRNIRTGTNYSSATGNTFSYKETGGQTIQYSLSNGTIQESKGGGFPSPLTDPSVTITSLTFYPAGTTAGDSLQSRVTIIVSGDVPSGSNRTEHFTIQTGATMRGTDL